HYLQGLSKEETARQLRCPVGTVSSRLHRGQEQLRRRLVRRGVTLSAAALGAMVPAQPLPAGPVADRISALVRMAAGGGRPSAGVGVRVAALAREVARPMRLARLGVIVGILLVGTAGTVAVVFGSFGGAAADAAADGVQPGPDQAVAPAKRAAER